MILSSGLTLLQAKAILSILIAFGLDSSSIDNIQKILIPPVAEATTTQAFIPVQVVQTPIRENAPIYFGSTQPAPTPVVQSKPMEPKWNIDLQSNINGDRTGHDRTQLSDGDSVTVTTNDSLTFFVSVYDKKGNKIPVIVATNDPDLPSSFVINATIDSQISSNGAVGTNQYFAVAKPYPYEKIANGSYGTGKPTSTGTFNFTFTVEDVSKTVQVTVTP